MNFKPTQYKITVSIAVVIIFYLILFSRSNSVLCNLLECPPTFNAVNCEKVFILHLLPEICGGECSCPEPTSITDIIKDIFILLSPGILVYIIWSILQKSN